MHIKRKTGLIVWIVLFLISLSTVYADSKSTQQPTTSPQQHSQINGTNELCLKIDKLQAEINDLKRDHKTDVDAINKKINAVYSNTTNTSNTSGNVFLWFIFCIGTLIVILFGLLIYKLAEKIDKQKNELKKELKDIRSQKTNNTNKPDNWGESQETDVLEKNLELENQLNSLIKLLESKGFNMKDVPFKEPLANKPPRNVETHYINRPSYQSEEAKNPTPQVRDNEMPSIDYAGRGWNDELLKLIAIYNQATQSADAKEQFLKAYQPVEYDIENITERMNNSAIPYVFKTMSRGAYLLIQSSSRQDVYYIVPRFKKPIDKNFWGPGAMSEFFICNGFRDNLEFSSYRLVKPAIIVNPTTPYNRKVIKGEIALN